MVKHKLSNEQEQVLNHLTKDFLTVKKIALLRKTSVQAVYKTINKLKKKGLISGNQIRGFNRLKIQGFTPNHNIKKSERLVRLHNVSLKIKILEGSRFYTRLLNNKNIDYLDDNTVRLYRETLIVHINRDFLFEDEYKCSKECLNHINRLLLKLENRFSLVLIRPNYTTVKLLTNHYSEINNELAEEYNKEGIKLNIYGTDDGKLWFTIDNSFQLNEAETPHPERARSDMTKVRAVFNDYRDNMGLPLPSEIYKIVCGVVKGQLDITSNMSYFAENMRSHVKAINTMSEILERLEKKIRGKE